MKKNNQRLAETIKLTEYGDEREIQLTDLTDREREIWEEDFLKQLKLRWTHDGKSFVKATGYTGILALPRYNISIEPRIPNANYNAMLTYALQLGKVLKDPIPIEKDYDFWKYLVLVFSKRLEILGRNFYRSYIEVEENLNLVRGKIDFTQHLLHNFKRPDKIYCRFTDFTMNVLENQLIKTTLYKLIHGFQFIPFPDKIKKSLRSSYNRFDFVDLILTDTKPSFNLITYTRLNDHYRGILKICELILRKQSSNLTKLDSKLGLAYFVKTHDLFQGFIHEMLRQRNSQEKLGLKIRYQKGVHWDELEKKKPHTPDFRIKKGQNELILDTKYYEEKETKEEADPIIAGRSIPIHNIAQMVFYSNSTKIKKLCLLYPGKHSPDKIEIKNGIELHVLHIDLEAKTTDEFEKNCDELKDQLLNLI